MPRQRSHAAAGLLVRGTGASVAVLILGGLSLLPAGGAQAADLTVRYDQSQLLRLPRPVAEVIIGNPSIADVTVQGGNLLVVTGKTFGVTNIIALDDQRNVIQDQRVVVQQDDERIVNVTKAGVRQSYSCTPNCSPTMTIGDDNAYFDMVSRHSSVKTRFSDSTSDPNNGQQGSN